MFSLAEVEQIIFLFNKETKKSIQTQKSIKNQRYPKTLMKKLHQVV